MGKVTAWASEDGYRLFATERECLSYDAEKRLKATLNQFILYGELRFNDSKELLEVLRDNKNEVVMYLGD